MRSSEYFYSESSAASEAAKIKKFSAKKLSGAIDVVDGPQKQNAGWSSKLAAGIPKVSLSQVAKSFSLRG
jgi:hypothetical protein